MTFMFYTNRSALRNTGMEFQSSNTKHLVKRRAPKGQDKSIYHVLFHLVFMELNCDVLKMVGL